MFKNQKFSKNKNFSKKGNFQKIKKYIYFLIKNSNKSKILKQTKFKIK